jgi:hypothetical protein
MKNKVIGYRMGEFEGIKRDEYIKPIDIGSKPVPNWKQNSKMTFEKLFEKEYKNKKKNGE